MGSAPATAMARPVLRPGLHVVRRDDEHLQIGLDEPDRLVLRDRPGLLDALRALPRLPADPSLLATVESLAREGWLVDDGRTSADTAPPLALTVDAPLLDAVARAGRVAGVGFADSAGLRLVATVGEPRREVSDALMRGDVPHLWLAAFPERVRVGPLVEPGRSACLRCLDAHLGERDPRRATVLHQLGERPPGSETAYDAALALAGAGLALRALAGHLAGRPSGLRSTTLTVGSDLAVSSRVWLRHPHCGCAWG
ncbi:TOMM precursor leader peptide-binding protein [Nocardioides cynanchi]|uniref:TOMM precursor leader peptide-binding protein n=1 Tax=Nocardioides cynanchi TaxID=2558918 RepID=UPI00177EA4F2|nr:TOMM precursor leader peptide-binding protein [Nocardioides cynanchi]